MISRNCKNFYSVLAGVRVNGKDDCAVQERLVRDFTAPAAVQYTSRKCRQKSYR